MDFKKVKEILNDSKYWRMFLNLNTNMEYLTTEFKIKKYGVCTDLCQENDNFYIGEFVIISDFKGKHCCSWDNYIIYDLYYKQLKYSNILYVDFRINNDTYTKPIRIKKNETLYNKKVQDKIKEVIFEFERLYMMDIALKNYHTDNIEYLNLEYRIKGDK